LSSLRVFPANSYHIRARRNNREFHHPAPSPNDSRIWPRVDLLGHGPERPAGCYTDVVNAPQLTEIPAIDRLVADLTRHPEVVRVWLFGSRARGDQRPRSDIDLAVEAPGASRRAWLDLCRLVEEADTLLRIDLVRIEEAPPALAQQIRREGRVLHER